METASGDPGLGDEGAASRFPVRIFHRSGPLRRDSAINRVTGVWIAR